MAKKGGAQKLQEDISTDEDFEKFLERPGLLVLDVYSEWCGPCLGMVGSLRKIKLEIGGDNLSLAICKSDTISSLKRFNKKSEPIWLFVQNGQSVNIMYGSDVPRLTNMIVKELHNVIAQPHRTGHAIKELHPIEVEQARIKLEAAAEAERIESEAKAKKREDYLTSVTNTIMENLPDVGVTLFGPQVNRDMFKKLSEPADALKVQCKDRKTIVVMKEDFDVVNFACKNPLPADVIEQLHEKELFLCFWKVDESVGTMPNVLLTYAHELTKERVETDEFSDEEHVLPPIITTMKVKVEVELEDGEEWEDSESLEESASRKTLLKDKEKRLTSVHGVEELKHPFDEEGDEEGEEEVESEDDDGGEPKPMMDMSGFAFDMDFDNDEEVQEEEEVDDIIEDIPKILTRTKSIKIPPIWVPNNARTHAALIYVFFRSQTSGFLPPDPKPAPPHVIMAFDVHKKKDLVNVVERHKDDIPLYGFFTSDDPEEAQFITNSIEKYNAIKQNPSDKIILKVNKVQSNTMLSLVSYGPSYVSPNPIVGQEEALRFFPESYKSSSQEEEEAMMEEASKPKKRKRSKKYDDGRESFGDESPRSSTESKTIEQPPTSNVAAETNLPSGEGVEGSPAAPDVSAPGADGAPAPPAPTDQPGTDQPADPAPTDQPGTDQPEQAAPQETAPAAEAEAPPPAE